MAVILYILISDA
jgi:hypothetical protein